MLNTIQNAKLTEVRRLNQMIQEQCRTRCGTGGGRFANAVTAVSKLVGASARSGAGEEAIASWCESETCSELTTERSIGRMLQLQVRGCHARQLSLATAEYVWAAACWWQQGLMACWSAAASSHWEQFAAPASQLAQCAGGGRINATARNSALALRIESVGRVVDPNMPELSHGGRGGQV